LQAEKIKKMNRLLLTVVLSTVFTVARADWDMLFCLNADSVSTCKGRGETFIYNKDNNSLQVMVINKESLKVDKLSFMIFMMKTEKEGTLYADLTQVVTPDALFAVKKIKFYKPGTYKIDVLDASTHSPLTTGTVTITE
jgi:hypothetical protein